MTHRSPCQCVTMVFNRIHRHFVVRYSVVADAMYCPTTEVLDFGATSQNHYIADY